MNDHASCSFLVSFVFMALLLTNESAEDGPIAVHGPFSFCYQQGIREPGNEWLERLRVGVLLGFQLVDQLAGRTHVQLRGIGHIVVGQDRLEIKSQALANGEDRALLSLCSRQRFGAAVAIAIAIAAVSPGGRLSIHLSRDAVDRRTVLAVWCSQGGLWPATVAVGHAAGAATGCDLLINRLTEQAVQLADAFLDDLRLVAVGDLNFHRSAVALAGVIHAGE